VKFAAQTLSTSTADALDNLRLINYPNFSNTKATVEYCRNIDRIFDFLNARNHFAQRHIENTILSLIYYLFSLNSDKLLYKTNKKTFIFGFATAVKSMFAIAKSLFIECPEFKQIKFATHLIAIRLKLTIIDNGDENENDTITIDDETKKIILKIECKSCITALLRKSIDHD
ncbi:THAP domain-containing protein 9, partial [Aphis craccivora]